MLDLTNRRVVLGVNVARMEEPKGCSLTIRYAPANPSAIGMHPGHHLSVGDTYVGTLRFRWRAFRLGR